MTTPFILRFQELCVDAGEVSPASGTQTVTSVRAEQIDADPDRPKYALFGSKSCMAGTSTKTAIEKEHTDSDRSLSSLPVIPRSMGTQTFTKVHAEAADQDPGKHRFQVIPQCFSS